MSEQHEPAKEVLRDLRSGMSDTALMDKHGLSYGELRSLLKELFDSGTLLQSQPTEQSHPSELYLHAKHRSLSEANVGLNKRDSRRQYLEFDLPVYEAELPDNLGTLRDISEEGVGLVGVQAEINEIKTLVVLGDTFGEVAPFEFQARCCWIDGDKGEKDWATGFRITDISDDDAYQLQKLLRLDLA
jgi:PilZ domain